MYINDLTHSFKNDIFFKNRLTENRPVLTGG